MSYSSKIAFVKLLPERFSFSMQTIKLGLKSLNFDLHYQSRTSQNSLFLKIIISKINFKKRAPAHSHTLVKKYYLIMFSVVRKHFRRPRKGLPIKCVTLFWTYFYPLPCYNLSHIWDSLKYVTFRNFLDNPGVNESKSIFGTLLVPLPVYYPLLSSRFYLHRFAFCRLYLSCLSLSLILC